MSRAPLPTTTDVVVVGGGVMGLSTAYHLAREGADVVLIERGQLGEGSTSRAAGGVRALFSDEVNTRLGLASLEVFERFEHDFGQPIDLHQPGYLFLLDDAADAQRFAADTIWQHALGVDSRVIDVAEAVRLAPMIDPVGLVAAVLSPRAGHCSPESVVLGYATGARRHGARIATGCAATGIAVEAGQISAVHTSLGTIATSTVVCATGAWSGEVGRWAGIDLPVRPLRRQIVVTEPVEVRPDLPFTIDFGTSFYFHREGGGLLMGASDAQDSWGFDTARDQDFLEVLAARIGHRAPSLSDVGIASGWAGLYEVTPDHNALIGEAAEVSRFLYATGFSGHGFLMGPAVGEVMAHLVLGHTPRIDVSALSAERFAAGTRLESNIV